MSDDVVQYLAPAAAGALGGFLGPGASDALGLGLDAVTAEALGGGLAGALTGGLVGKGGITGALTGGLEGAAAGPLFDLGVNSIFGAGTVPGTGVPAFGGIAGGQPSFDAKLASTPATGGGAGAAALTPGFGGNASGNFGPEGAASADLTSAVPGAAAGAAGGAGGIGQFLTQNKSWLVPAAGIGMAALKGNTQTPAESALNSQAAGLTAQQQQLLKGLTTGTVPAGAEAAIQSGANAAKANIRSTFASMGLGGSTMEASALANVDQSIAEQRFTIAQQLATTGLSEARISGQIYSELMNSQLQQDQNLQNAIADFGVSLAGGQGGKTGTFNITAA